MYYTIVSAVQAEKAGRIDRAASEGAWWVKFGDETLVYAADSKWRAASEALDAGEPVGKVRKGNLHLVVQKGRTFQLEHPDIDVILDKGRYLVVDMEPKAARTVAGRADPCYHIENLRENSVVFDTLSLERRAPRADLRPIVDALRQETFEVALDQFVSFPTRLSTSDHYDAAAEWARARLTALGYTVSVIPVSVGTQSSSNVVAIKSGTSATPGSVYAVAHLDSVNSEGGPSAPAPGADDNASGSAGVIALAEAAARQVFAHDLVFILFGGEEQGLHGSLQYVAGLNQSERARIRAVINMDMIGHVNATPQSVLLEGATVSQLVIDGLADAASQFSNLAIQVSLNPFASDHVPFINEGLPAVLTIEGADGANDQIHTAGDVRDRVDAAFAMQILRMNAGYVAAVAEISASAAVPGPTPTSPPPQGCSGCQESGSADSAALNQLRMHYQALLAQYSRLQHSGSMTHRDVAGWQAARTAYDRLGGDEAQ